MKYDHTNKIGNQGDLIKHLTLTVAISRMAETKHAFTYLDVHSGRARYDLSDSGEWGQGIGKFAGHCAENAQLPEDLAYFYDVQSLNRVNRERKYWGSSRIVLNVLLDQGLTDIRMILCDTDSAVCRDLKEHYQDRLLVAIHCMDGYRKAYDTGGVDLVLIDPPDISAHYTEFTALMGHCLARGQSFISWNSLHGNSIQQGMSSKCLSISRWADESGISSFSVRWKKGWSRQMCGCQVLFSVPGAGRVADACGDLVKLMGWSTVES
ncbi:MAG: 23S rRNA (adenine(2030)-N(6))-methyltransferase RlmJ [Gammaproteobacteria bacterium]|nr:23S rRNA (adenine(2030)-N(6))-methyltransferase RlmJ [Gammaproteobacteria bacterium]